MLKFRRLKKKCRSERVNKDSDSKGLVTGFAFDSGVSYILTKKNTNQSLVEIVEISKIELSGNDYELSPFTNFTYNQKYTGIGYHHPLRIVDGFFFTNNGDSILIFDKDGDLDQEKSGLNFDEMLKNGIRCYIPQITAQIGGSTLYAYIEEGKLKQGLAYSLVNPFTTGCPL